MCFTRVDNSKVEPHARYEPRFRLCCVATVPSRLISRPPAGWPASLLELCHRLLLLDFLQLLLPGLTLRELMLRLLLRRTLDGDSLRGHPTVYRVHV
mgnify:CR=1 FL=1